MRHVAVKLLPDKSGRVRIHYFVHTPDGPAQTPGRVAMTAMGPLRLGGSRGKIACQPGLADVTPQAVGGSWHLCCHSDDPRAVTCPECEKTEDYQKAMALLAEVGGLATGDDEATVKQREE